MVTDLIMLLAEGSVNVVWFNANLLASCLANVFIVLLLDWPLPLFIFLSFLSTLVSPFKCTRFRSAKAHFVPAMANPLKSEVIRLYKNVSE